MRFQDKVVYQIYIRSFYDSNGDGIGDLKGISQKLDYLSYLGVDYLWITPFFVSPQKDNGYDVANYYQIDPIYGTMEDFEELSREAKKRNIGLMLDMVFNHTSTEHEWFQRALAGEEKYQNYYIFREGREGGKEPTNWISKFGGSAWEYVESLGKYYLHLFDRSQADLNWDNPEVREEMSKIVRFWQGKGVSGFRFDVVNLISKPSLFEDDQEGDGRRFYTDGPNIHRYLKELNLKSFGQDKSMITVGEMSSTSLENCYLYAGEEQEELSMVFNFHHLKVDYANKDKWQLKDFDFQELKTLFNTWQLGMQEHRAWSAMFWCNHDQPRAVSRFGDDKKEWQKSAKMLAASIHMLRGIPYIYQGEEIGMTNCNFTKIEDYQDVESYNYYKILQEKGLSSEEAMKVIRERSRDNGRTPVQWNASKEAGFTTGKPWLSVVPNYPNINVEAQLGKEDSILEFYRSLIRLRKEYRVIAEGKTIPIQETHPDVYAYKRVTEEEELLVLVNFYGKDTKIILEEDLEGYHCILHNREAKKIEKTMSLEAYDVFVYYR